MEEHQGNNERRDLLGIILHFFLIIHQSVSLIKTIVVHIDSLCI